MCLKKTTGVRFVDTVMAAVAPLTNGLSFHPASERLVAIVCRLEVYLRRYFDLPVDERLPVISGLSTVSVEPIVEIVFINYLYDAYIRLLISGNMSLVNDLHWPGTVSLIWALDRAYKLDPELLGVADVVSEFSARLDNLRRSANIDILSVGCLSVLDELRRSSQAGTNVFDTSTVNTTSTTGCMDCTTDRTVGSTMHRLMDRTTDQTVDRTMDRTVDRTEDRTADRTVIRTVDRMVNRVTEKMTEAPVDGCSKVKAEARSIADTIVGSTVGVITAGEVSPSPNDFVSTTLSSTEPMIASPSPSFVSFGFVRSTETTESSASATVSVSTPGVSSVSSVSNVSSVSSVPTVQFGSLASSASLLTQFRIAEPMSVPSVPSVSVGSSFGAMSSVSSGTSSLSVSPVSSGASGITASSGSSGSCGSSGSSGSFGSFGSFGSSGSSPVSSTSGSSVPVRASHQSQTRYPRYHHEDEPQLLTHLKTFYDVELDNRLFDHSSHYNDAFVPAYRFCNSKLSELNMSCHIGHTMRENIRSLYDYVSAFIDDAHACPCVVIFNLFIRDNYRMYHSKSLRQSSFVSIKKSDGSIVRLSYMIVTNLFPRIGSWFKSINNQLVKKTGKTHILHLDAFVRLLLQLLRASASRRDVARESIARQVDSSSSVNQNVDGVGGGKSKSVRRLSRTARTATADSWRRSVKARRGTTVGVRRRAGRGLDVGLAGRACSTAVDECGEVGEVGDRKGKSLATDRGCGTNRIDKSELIERSGKSGRNDRRVGRTLSGGSLESTVGMTSGSTGTNGALRRRSFRLSLSHLYRVTNDVNILVDLFLTAYVSCKHERLKRTYEQLRSNDESATLVRLCLDCGHRV